MEVKDYFAGHGCVFEPGWLKGPPPGRGKRRIREGEIGRIAVFHDFSGFYSAGVGDVDLYPHGNRPDEILLVGHFN